MHFVYQEKKNHIYGNSVFVIRNIELYLQQHGAAVVITVASPQVGPRSYHCKHFILSFPPSQQGWYYIGKLLNKVRIMTHIYKRKDKAVPELADIRQVWTHAGQFLLILVIYIYLLSLQFAVIILS